MSHYIKVRDNLCYKLENKELLHYSGKWYDPTKYNFTENDRDFWDIEYIKKHSHRDSHWIVVSDLTELKVWEYNKLVEEILKVDNNYDVNYLKGKFL